MPCGRQESNTEGSEKPKPKLKSKSRQTKSSQKRRTLKNSYPNFDNLHPDVKKNMNKLQDLYSHIINNFAPLKSNMPNIFDTDLMARTFSETHQVMVDTYVEKPQVWDAKQKNYLGNLDKLYKRMIDRLQGIEVEPIITPKKNDKRFKSAEWEEFPAFDYLKQSYLLHSNYINDLIESLDEIDPKTKEKAKFYVRNFMDAISPTNSPFTNPEVMKETIRTQGKNLVEGYQKLLNDNENSNFMSLPMFTDFENFDVGENLATTEGKVVFETPLFQLLYYKPTTELVHERPLLMIPPWINKFYIFDLQKDNSFVQWALDKGLSVFIISWINPDKAFAKFGFEEYVLEGALLAVEKVLEITSQKKLNLLAYCTGGVAATILAAYLAKKPKNNPIESISLLAAPINFEKMGDLKVFICDEQITSLEKRLKKIGYFPGDEMVRVFSLLRANDLIWSNFVNTYFLNKDLLPLDFLYWNCDTTNIPAKLHTEYLRHIFLENAFMHANSFSIGGVKIDLKKIKTPIFAFATRSDHIVPWESAYAIKEICPSNTTFVLGASGHVAGIVNPVHKNKYCFWRTNQDIIDASPEGWLEKAEEVPGSWWPEWFEWIKKHAGEKKRINIWETTENIEPAPGRYVLSTSPRDNF